MTIRAAILTPSMAAASGRVQFGARNRDFRRVPAFKNPKSRYHLSLYVNYPNVVDREYAASQDRKPGGEIFIHGGPKNPVKVRDWTEGCIAVTDDQIEEVYSMVNVGTPIHILP